MFKSLKKRTHHIVLSKNESKPSLFYNFNQIFPIYRRRESKRVIKKREKEKNILHKTDKREEKQIHIPQTTASPINAAARIMTHSIMVLAGVSVWFSMRLAEDSAQDETVRASAGLLCLLSAGIHPLLPLWRFW